VDEEYSMAMFFDALRGKGETEFALSEEDIEDMVVSFLEKKGEQIPRGEIQIYFDTRYGHDCPHIVVASKHLPPIWRGKREIKLR
jgi:hypothetical protein